MLGPGDRDVVSAGDEKPTRGREALRISQHPLAQCRSREGFSEPRDRGNEFDARADNGETPPEEQGTR